MIRLESSDAANLSAEAVAMGYRSGEGISPGRLLRTAQALARAIMITLHSTHLLLVVLCLAENGKMVFAMLLRPYW